ncbi:NAD(P)-dependent alcohol dehydrogenase [Xanthomonas vesicatoria]|uniref:NAD(P)-dependent alcohol dehydrogenase n=2 Tax=Xanthomonas vesicatoria TaxID=56460 RepID=UPI000F8E165A|nr:NAD(P)-dependent alcohol dehydrogenase [Xanthomonas vesicatoria]MCC8558519.1 NAD(P)-dependent alcohol dehydrogenase [Xanthomonas vesicatoria]MCC8599352.1 NAD(P)-dependent alcohol dehydrogenase [Xanthomonas vesicatoria]MCC8608575.1 NAD(P)-dependent alcohol dehydrogenase [Xanthomonas vesicatoria]MCC8672897.1 NAD(P)-dependent alcohol dehydrogenase [Xanthomonas vesicatoria]MCC8678895.1 NAD(P)-dependent alcohol dehydrogenase [Xanthomonas vesicatoria]
MSQAHAFAAQAADQPLAPFVFERREPGPNDVQIDIAYCGVCHSDLHTARNEWHNTLYPSVPGHEIVGRVTAVGDAVTGFKVGDLAGVGCMVDSCRSCASCQEGEEQYCEQGFTGTYNGPMLGGGENTYGGYSDHIVVDQKYVLRISHTDNLAAVAPLLCAGITTYSPLAHWKVGPGQKVGVVGLGGLGHMAVKIAKAMGATVVLFTTSESKRADAMRLGASEVVISKDEAQMAAQYNTLDFILNTVAAPHNLDPFLNALKRDGAMVLVGVPEESHPSPSVFNLVMKRRTLAGSLIGGIRQTQEMLDFCAKHNIVSDIETIRADEINTAYERMLKSDVKYRFVIDMATLDKAA